jgi:GTP pyrophosphokinase
MATLAILIDYHYMDPVLLKASVIHDLFEDIEGYDPFKIIRIDEHGCDVYDLVMEVTKSKTESKVEYLKKIKETATIKAKILKVADRISNLPDLHNDIFDIPYMTKYLEDTELYVHPMALEVDTNMAIEVMDLIIKRREMISLIEKD